jgi:ribosomal peptide maturation radical SAM protein 1
MPFFPLYPSLQLGLLRAIGTTHGFAVDTYPLYLDFARSIGESLYEGICDNQCRLAGEWLFSPVAFGASAPDPDGRFVEDFQEDLVHILDYHDDMTDAALHRVLGPAPTGERWWAREDVDLGRLHHIRRTVVPEFVERALDTVPWSRYRVVGFTSTFQQNVASLALARGIKERFPDVVTVIGGANCDGGMGRELFAAAGGALDYAVSGEGDTTFPRLLLALLADGDPADVPGVICRRAGEVVQAEPEPPFEQLDELPVPDFSEFFERAGRLGMSPIDLAEGGIPFESSRGCWWGERSQCTFCGLNGTGMAYRMKSPPRVAAELETLAVRHRARTFVAVDTIIHPSYITDFFPLLPHGDEGYRFYYEAKSNLSRGAVEALARGGVFRLQPGIESLSSHVLHLMRKGVRAAQNVNVLRWGRYYGMTVVWNLLYGFPGERERDYVDQLALIPKLAHLEPPLCMARIRMDRFSPLFEDESKFPAVWKRPEASYRYIYPTNVNIDELAYFFEYELEHVLDRAVYEGVRAVVEDWQVAWRRAEVRALTFTAGSEGLRIVDLRHGAEEIHEYDGCFAALYQACSDEPTSRQALVQTLEPRHSARAIDAAIEELVDQAMMLRDGSLLLSLALPDDLGP